MDEEIIETQDADTEVDKTTENESEIDTSGEDIDLKKKVEEMEKTIKTLTIQKKKAQEKAKTNVETKQPQTDDISELKERLDLRDFRDSHPDLDTEDIQEIHSIAKANGKTLEEALSLNIVKGYLSNKQEQKRIENASIETNRSPKGENNKPLFYEGQSEDEFKSNWQKYMSSLK